MTNPAPLTLSFTTSDGVETTVRLRTWGWFTPGEPTRCRVFVTRDGELIDPGVWDSEGACVIDSAADLGEDVWEQIDHEISAALGE